MVHRSTVPVHHYRMDKRKSFIFPRQYRNSFLTHCCQKLTNQNNNWHGDTQFSWLKDNDLPPCCRHCLFLTHSYRKNPIFSLNVTSETCSKGRFIRSNFFIQLFFSPLFKTTIGCVNDNFWQVSDTFYALDENRACSISIRLDQKSRQFLIFPCSILQNILTKWPPLLDLAAVKWA